MRKTLFNLGIIAVLVFSLAPLVAFVQKSQQILSKATIKPADIVVKTDQITGVLPDFWQALAQGGEEADPFTLSPVLEKTAQLSPKYIRIDHIYDFYQVVERGEDGSLSFSFAKLDILVNDILKTGAKPFFSLSYMPPVLAKDGQVTGFPLDLREWQLLVKETIEHYSGRDNFNLTDVYYEVWNEPDLFGRFTITAGEKDYLSLYVFAALGAKEAQNVNRFYFGGPATTGPLLSWFKKLIEYSDINGLPLDFISWHYYGADLNKLKKEIQMVNNVLDDYPGRQIQKVISEWGIDSELNSAYDQMMAAAYTLAGIRETVGELDLLFIFEIKDGLSPKNEAFWGRWGLFTHENFGTLEKPRFTALKMLASLPKNQLQLTGEGSFVGGWASRQSDLIKVLLYNWDWENRHYEKVPLTLTNLANGIYHISQKSLKFQNELIEEKKVSDGSLSLELIFAPNDVWLIEVFKVADNLVFSQGRQPHASDQSLELAQDNYLPVFPLEINQVNSFNLDFWFKPYWSGRDSQLAYPLFKLAGAGGQSLIGRFQPLGFSSQLVFGLALTDKLQEDFFVSLPVSSWVINHWYHLTFSYKEGVLNLTIDDQVKEKKINFMLLPFNQLQLQKAQGTIDDLVFEVNGQVLLEKKFNGSLD